MKVQIFVVNNYKQPMPVTPIGAVCVAGAARAAGHQVAMTDLCFDDDVREPIARAIESFEPDVIGISVRNIDNVFYSEPVSFMPRLKESVDACRAKSDAPIVLGGPGFSMLPEDVLAHCDLSLGIHGEGEKAFPLLLERIEAGRSPSDVPGVVMRSGNGWLRNPRDLVPQLDLLPSPAVDLYDRRYGAPDLEPVAHSAVETKRGCAFNCAYCTYPMIQGNELRFRSPKQVAREVKALVDAVGPNVRVDLVDNVFNYPLDHAIEVCEALIAERVNVGWDCAGFQPAHCSDKLLSKMVESGCRFIGFGADQGSEKMLKVMNKGFDRDTLRKNLLACKATGIPMAVALLLGAPGEDIHTIEETLSLMEEVDIASLVMLYGIRVYPGTRLERMLVGSQRPPGEQWLDPWFCAEGFTDEARKVFDKYLAAHPTWFMPGLQGENKLWTS